jgi:hypothetical protein
MTKNVVGVLMGGRGERSAGVCRNKGVDTKLAAFAEAQGQSSRY